MAAVALCRRATVQRLGRRVAAAVAARETKKREVVEEEKKAAQADVAGCMEEVLGIFLRSPGFSNPVERFLPFSILSCRSISQL